MTRLLYIACFLLALSSGVRGQALDTFWLSGTTDIEDGVIRSGDSTTNYGSTTQHLFGNFISQWRLVISTPYLADSIGAHWSGWNIKAVAIALYEDGTFIAAVNTEAYYVVKPYIEAEATWNRWDDANSKEWGSAGIENTGSSYNESDGSGDDRGGASQGSVNINASFQWLYLDLDTAWVNASIVLDSVLAYVLIDAGGGLVGIHAAEYATDTTLSMRFRIIMEQAAVGPENVRHSPAGSGQRHGPDGASVRHEP